jgi:hypothetical protein
MADIASLITRRRRQFLVHSFLYYKLDTSIISDHEYDRICRELYELQRDRPDLAASLPYHELCAPLDASGSGFYLRDYPPEIVNKAFHLLAQHTGEPLADVAARYGYRLLKRERKGEG